MALAEFLNGHRADDVFTHGSMAGGKYFIPEDDIEKFYNLYCESIIDQEKQYLTESPTDVGPLRIDFDFIYPKDVKTHQHTSEQVAEFCRIYLDQIRECVAVPDVFDIYVMEKRKPTLDTKKDKMKSGIHIVVPGICTYKFVEQRVRRNLLSQMEDIFPLRFDEEYNVWSKVYDEGVVNRTIMWTMYGSRKPEKFGETLPYLIAYTLHTADGGRTFEKVKWDSGITPELLTLLSTRRSTDSETPLTEVGGNLYNKIKEKKVSISGGQAMMPKRGRKLVRKDQTEGLSQASGASERFIQPLDPTRKEYLQKHTMNLKPERAVAYDDWVKVGLCLHNIHPDLIDCFLDFSSQNADKYDEIECINKWNSFTFRNEGDMIGEGTLRYWSREDYREGYDEIEQGNIERLVKAACSSTEHDVACVIYAKFRDMYKCGDFGKNVWYKWLGHIWKETDQGIDLQIKLSKQIGSIFMAKMTALGKEMSEKGYEACTGPEKRDCGRCAYCDLETQRLAYSKVHMRLKTTGFKTNVMKECRELFFDEEFIKKLDSNKDLIAFNNGVLDTSTMVFRDGKPEDCISFSTNLDYNVDKPYYEYDAWSAIERFIHQVLPDKDVREYFLRHASTCLIGGNPSQKFHILTGSGSNGKSMFMNFISATLGDYACSVPISLFTQKRKSSGSAAPEVIRLKGRRFVTMQEPDEAVVLNTGLMKEITSGEKIFARDLFRSGTEFEIQAKFHLACNDKPKVDATDGGTWRRLLVIWFVSKFVANPIAANEYLINEQIEKLVQKPEWTQPFMSYLIHILREGNGYRKIQPPSKIMEYTSEYRNETDTVAKFLHEKIAAVAVAGAAADDTGGDGTDGVVTKVALRRVFRTWLDENGLRGRIMPQEVEKRIEAQYGKCPKDGWVNFTLAE